MSVKLFRSLLNFMASLKFGIVLLLLLALAMAAGTIIEAGSDASMASYYVYSSWWFRLLMVMLAHSVCFSMFKRWPWKRQHIGFISSHIGILLILFGCFISRTFGMQAHLELQEGSVATQVQLEGEQIKISAQDHSFEHKIIPKWKTGLFGGPPWIYEFPDTNTKLIVTDKIANAVQDEEVSDDGDTPNPAVQFELLNTGPHSVQRWLFANSDEANKEQAGPITVSFKVCSTSEELDKQVQNLNAAVGRTDSDYGKVHITFPELPTQDFDVKALLEKEPVPIKDSTWSIKITQYLPHAIVKQSKLVNASDRPVNPAVVLTLLTADGATEEHKAFSRFPDFATTHQNKQALSSNAQVRYEFEPSESDSGSNFDLFLIGDGGLFVLPPGDGERHLMPLEVGKEIETPFDGVGFVVNKFYPKAKLSSRWVPSQEESGQPAIAVTVSRGKDHGSDWVAWDSETMIPVGDTGVSVTLQPLTLDLGFQIKLLDFNNPTYGRSSMAARYYSDVEVSKEGQPSLKHRIGMNQPLVYDGLRFFQSSFRDLDGGKKISILSVSRDPGVPVVYLGFLVLVLGVFVIFYGRKGKHQPFSA